MKISSETRSELQIGKRCDRSNDVRAECVPVLIPRFPSILTLLPQTSDFTNPLGSRHIEGQARNQHKSNLRVSQGESTWQILPKDSCQNQVETTTPSLA